MNTVNIKPTVSTAVAATALPSAAEKNIQWQRELLMERIRSHASQNKTFPELSKAMRMSMLEKRYALDAVEKSNLQKCLDSMQHCIKVTSRQGLVERLESLSRQLGLKFMEDTSGLFISTDMFFLEIILDASGALTDVKVHHECKIEQQSCSELVNCLNRGDFADFTVQLEGLSSIYQLNAEPKVKTKAFVALQAMETDLYNLYQMQQFSKDTQQVLAESAVGIVLKRRGGHPMKLTYFVSPYDLISLQTKSLEPLSIDLITNRQLGLSVTVNLEASSANKLQILPTITFSKDAQTGIELPVYAPLTQINSMLLPATFVLRLNKPLPVCQDTLRALGIGSLTGAVSADTETTLHSKPSANMPTTIMNLVVQTASEQQLKNSQKGLFVCLPDQMHCYFFTENKQLKATIVSSVPFTEPAQVPKILDFLKKQALFYTLLASCVRTQSKMGSDMDSTTILEVNAISFQQISVSLQHPYEESMATVEFDLRDGSVKCTIYSISHSYDLLSLKLTNVVQKSLSIPVTIRALLRFWDQERMKMFQRSIGGGGDSLGGGGSNGTSLPQASAGAAGFGNFNLAMGPNDPGGGGGSGGVGVGNSNNTILKMETNARQQALQNATPVAGFLQFKTDVKKEDFHESPKSQTQTTTPSQFVEASSLGQQQSAMLQQSASTQIQLQQHLNVKSTEIEIADKYKNIWKDKTPNLKNSVSITPISSDVATTAVKLTQPSAVSVDVKRSGGIEIIPLTQQTTTANTVAAAAATSSTITITPINPTGLKDKMKSTNTTANAPANSSSSSSNSANSSKRSFDAVVAAAAADAQKEKKRKKKRDDSPMGPPEKVYSRQNSPAATSDAAATVVARKFSSPSSSPKGSSGGLLASAAGSSLSARPSPKHSPVYSSPKHNTASNSPKSPFGTHSPKHGSSGKPSMSTLKNAAATSLSPKADKTAPGSSSSVSGTTAATAAALVRSLASSGQALAVGSTNSVANTTAATIAAAKCRDKEKSLLSTATAAAVSPSAAAKSAANMSIAAMQQLKSVAGLNHLANAGILSGFGGGGGATAMELNAAAMRKGVAGAVSLMTSTAATATTALQLQQPPHGSNDGAIGLSSSQSSEYMVKSSQEGLKLTINKTSNKTSSKKTKSNASSSSSTSASFLKKHTGLKPGVNSGPASKKPTTSGSATANKSSTSSSSSSHNTKHLFQKSNSSGSLSTKLSASAGGGLSKSNSTNSFADMLPTRKSSNHSASKKYERERSSSSAISSSSTSQPATRLDHHVDMMKILQYASPTMAASMEGFMKGLNTKFQIPKLSQRTTSAPTTPTTNAGTTTAITNNVNNTIAGSNIAAIATATTNTTASSATAPSVSVHILKSPAAHAMSNNNANVSNDMQQHQQMNQPQSQQPLDFITNSNAAAATISDEATSSLIASLAGK